MPRRLTLREVTEKLDRELNRLPVQRLWSTQKAMALTLAEELIKHTPVDTGELESSWHCELVKSAKGYRKLGGNMLSSPRVRDDSGVTRHREQLIKDTKKAVRNARVGDSFVFYNDEVYASVWDLGLFEPRNPGRSSDPRPARRGKFLVRRGYSLGVGPPQRDSSKGIIVPSLQVVLTKLRAARLAGERYS